MPLSPVEAIQDGTINSLNYGIETGGDKPNPNNLDGNNDETTSEFETSDKDDDTDYVPNSNSETSSDESRGKCTVDIEDLHDKHLYELPSSRTTPKTTSLTIQTKKNSTRTPEISPVQAITTVLPVEKNDNNLLYGKRNRQKDLFFL
ncbi:hypothetical protein RN001_005646 [Aquatica leii]|uniref:Uncharacterized protein n=1 Tax=Aquatica leii TaxID=1421715 RepID=A0AAN7PC59_9COLE|nr:hypothetical protein RN001_005646 [Aquatica leii]